MSTDSSNYVNLSSDSIAYLCCDNNNASYITSDLIVNALMDKKPRGILLYSMAGNCCQLSGDFSYTTVFTMTDNSSAVEALNITNGAGAGGIVQATITGNSTNPQQTQEDGQNGSNSAVAMSILYSITGLITLLFLIIIATGAIRAHRYPERYGPRSAYGGRPRQSRAKGLARAVLETLPIVKFGDPNPPKLDPALELEHQPTRSAHDPNVGTRLSSIPEEPQLSQQKRQSRMTPSSTLNQDAKAMSIASEDTLGSGSRAQTPDDEHLGCSICTEDFTVGEDVRVLPCDHKFHPSCIDPWLIDVSGTCPLW